MAKKKGQQPKTFPQIGQVWVDSSGEVDSYVHVDRRTTDTDKKECWECSRTTDGETTSCTLYLEDFAESFMQPEPGPAGAPTPLKSLFQILPTKKGSAIKCPSPTCGDKHEMEDAVTVAEYEAECQAFIARHEPHARDGMLPM